MHRDVCSLPISKALKQKLQKCGIEKVNDLDEIKPVDMIKCKIIFYINIYNSGNY